MSVKKMVVSSSLSASASASASRQQDLSTIGIECVFLSNNGSSTPVPSSSIEIIATIKKYPEDFIVKEISSFSLLNKNPSIADLSTATATETETETTSTKYNQQEELNEIESQLFHNKNKVNSGNNHKAPALEEHRKGQGKVEGQEIPPPPPTTITITRKNTNTNTNSSKNQSISMESSFTGADITIEKTPSLIPPRVIIQKILQQYHGETRAIEFVHRMEQLQRQANDDILLLLIPQHHQQHQQPMTPPEKKQKKMVTTTTTTTTTIQEEKEEEYNLGRTNSNCRADYSINDHRHQTKRTIFIPSIPSDRLSLFREDHNHDNNNDIHIHQQEQKDNSATTPKTTISGGGDRGALHRAIQQAYPFLCTQTHRLGGQINDSSNPTTTTNTAAAAAAAADDVTITTTIGITIDTTFFELAKYLRCPQKSLLDLYQFRRGQNSNNNNSSVGYSKTTTTTLTTITNGTDDAASTVATVQYPQNQAPTKNGDLGKDEQQQQQQPEHHEKKRKRIDYHQQKQYQQHHRQQQQQDRAVVILPLKPNLTKNDRRTVHHLISKTCRDLETSTLNNNNKKKNAKEAGDEEGTIGSAIVVSWSKKAQQQRRKRQQREQQQLLRRQEGNGSDRYHQKQQQQSHTAEKNLLFVMKKYKKEHLSAMQYLVQVIGCRQSDIGTAGIKDMQAITYQFVTLQNIRYSTIKKLHNIVKEQQQQQRGIELGGFKLVDWTLNQGDLAGNRFRIRLRNIHCVHRFRHRQHAATDNDDRKEDGNGSPATASNEEGVRHPCSREYFEKRIEAIKKLGVINFYGEQRLGVAGTRDEVGVRSFDIGRAMLQQDFQAAIDLIMTGRLVCRGGKNESICGDQDDDYSDTRNSTLEFPEVRNARKVWKESQGDVHATLKAMPKVNSGVSDVMARERIILKGLKRYGSNKPLDALRCLQFNIRMFYIHAYQSYVWNKMASARIGMGHKVMVGDLVQSEDGKVKTISEQDVMHYSLKDIILPLPGYNIVYPANQIGTRYREFLQSERVSFEKNAPAEAKAKGAYRKLVVFPTNVSCEFLEGLDDETKSCVVSFDLPAGSYATIVLRELMRS